ncbi:MAG: hypothetical protein BWZ01_02643 [Deltaproteobacteria bacterium ADurb.BinA179]|nr:MAG: hypothetical protein BWZ01_02643 [Deltaproteobacteria bacterium ADurb.BinA179]
MPGSFSSGKPGAHTSSARSAKARISAANTRELRLNRQPMSTAQARITGGATLTIGSTRGRSASRPTMARAAPSRMPPGMKNEIHLFISKGPLCPCSSRFPLTWIFPGLTYGYSPLELEGNRMIRPFRPISGAPKSCSIAPLLLWTVSRWRGRRGVPASCRGAPSE